MKIDPEPLDVLVDEDNNFKAVYKLDARQNLKIKAEGFVEVFSQPFRNIYKPLTDRQKSLFTLNQKYWETDNAFIKNKAQELKTAENIYKFVTDYLSYSQDRLKQPSIERKGAAAATLSPKDAVCMEFTDLFIAIARAAGIPAREVEGYAYTQNERLRPLSLALESGDILHAWPEFWDDNLGWVQVDPTWGNTSGGLDFFDKLDFNHITFVQRGVSSTYPYPAGSYKKDANRNKKDIAIDFAVELPNVTSTPSLNLVAPAKILAGIPTKITADIKNIGNSSIIGQTLTIKTSRLKKTSRLQNPSPGENAFEDSVAINLLPPFSKRQYTFSLHGTTMFQKLNDTIFLSYYSNQISAPIEIIPIYSLVFLKGFLVSASIAVSLISLGLFLYYRYAKKDHRKPLF